MTSTSGLAIIRGSSKFCFSESDDCGDITTFAFPPFLLASVNLCLFGACETGGATLRPSSSIIFYLHSNKY
jgi:hypothetical protein